MSDWWGAEWNSVCKRDGETRYIIFEGGMPLVFGTRAQARHWVKEKYGYIRYRPALQEEPHGWRVPRVVRIRISAKVIR